jgi:hypothetical protein
VQASRSGAGRRSAAAQGGGGRATQRSRRAGTGAGGNVGLQRTNLQTTARVGGRRDAAAQVRSQLASGVASRENLGGGVGGDQRGGAGLEHGGVQAATDVGSVGTVLSSETSQKESNLGRFGVASYADESTREGILKLVGVLDELRNAADSREGVGA